MADDNPDLPGMKDIRKKDKKPAFPGLDALRQLQEEKNNPTPEEAPREETREERTVRQAGRSADVKSRREAGKARRDAGKARRAEAREQRKNEARGEAPPEPAPEPTPFPEPLPLDVSLADPPVDVSGAEEMLTPPPVGELGPPPKKPAIALPEGGAPRAAQRSFPRINIDAKPEGEGGAGAWTTYTVLGWEGVVDPASSMSSPDSSESSKSTAIVPAPWLGEDGFAALFIHEMPEVRFDDVMTVPLDGRITKCAMDGRYVQVCHPGSIQVCGWSGDRPGNLGFRVEGGFVVIEAGRFCRPREVVIRLTGVRLGFQGLRLPSRTREQFEANEAFINSAYPAESEGDAW